MKLIYDAKTGKTYEEPDDEVVVFPEEPNPAVRKPTMQEQLQALQETVDLLVLEKLSGEESVC